MSFFATPASCLTRFLPAALPLLMAAMFALSGCSSAGNSPAPSTPSTGSASGSADGSAMVSVRVVAAGDKVALVNPERGVYRWAWTDLPQLQQMDAANAYANGYRMLYTPVRLDAWRDTALPDSLLVQLEQAFAVARASGIKVIPRFAYNDPAGETEYHAAQDAPLERVLAHIAQLKPVLRRNADVIALLQAGFIGAWGEWHTSSYNLTEVGPRTQIRDALLDALPADHFIAFRYTGHLMDWYPGTPNEAMAFNASANARSAFHNDCFLASDTDVGTYSGDAATGQREREAMAARAKITPFGGETCNPADDPQARPRTTCDDVLREGAQYSLSYLNDAYYRTLFHDAWIEGGCYEQVQRKMGYRLELASAAHSSELPRGGTLQFNFSVRNSGWSRPFGKRGVRVVLRHRGSGETLVLDAGGVDPRKWTAGGSFNQALKLPVPSTASTGAYDVYLALPDGATTLAQDPRYSIQFANADNAVAGQGWDEGLGAFKLGSTVTLR
ncbi:MAG: DUF4832 domain-containing protein [Pseudoxanthomonas sp.]